MVLRTNSSDEMEENFEFGLTGYNNNEGGGSVVSSSSRRPSLASVVPIRAGVLDPASSSSLRSLSEHSSLRSLAVGSSASVRSLSESIETNSSVVRTAAAVPSHPFSASCTTPHQDPHDADRPTTATSNDPLPSLLEQGRRSKSLVWSNINMSVRRDSSPLLLREELPKKNSVVKILDSVSGSLPPCKVTAIMGPSGAGKTSLLNVLAGRSTGKRASQAGVTVTSDHVLLDERSTHRYKVRRQIAFVAQDDSLPPTSTPREAILFSARLRLPRATSRTELHDRTDRLLRELGLTHCADTVVGGTDSVLVSISGGERKRTSVGVELVVRPSVLFLDEPTSGLDSYSALQLVRTLRRVSRQDHTSVLCTIHQPSSEVFHSFDHLLLLHKGRTMFRGDLDHVEPYFAQRGRPVPLRYNPADWIMHVAQATSVHDLNKAGFFDNNNNNNSSTLGTSESTHTDLSGDIERGPKSHVKKQKQQRVTLSTELATLLKRELTNITRDPAVLGARMGLNVAMAILIGIIFWHVGGLDDGDITIFQSHFGAVFMVLLNAMFGSALPTLLSFPQERPVFLREYSTEHYSVFTYFLSRLVMESSVTLLQVMLQTTIAYHAVRLQMAYTSLVCIAYALAMTSTAVAVMLGCAVQDPKLGQELLPVIFVPQMLFAGFFVAAKLIPGWLRWIQYLCPLMYSTRLILLAEFEFCERGLARFNCNRLLENSGAVEGEQWWYWVALLGLFFFYRIIGLVILRRKASCY